MSFYRRSFVKQLGMLLTAAFAKASPSAAAPATSVDIPDTAAVQSAKRDETVITAEYDLIVVGGGISGTSAAISAARNGLRVALVHERSMLGGNSSSEVKLFPENNADVHPWIKEGGIHEQFHTEERVRNHLAYFEGTMNCHWDLV